MNPTSPHRRPAMWALVFIGGALGTACRILAGQVIPRGVWPWATLSVNLVGAFILGWLTEATLRHHGTGGARWRALAGTGFCGGLTTYSTLALDVATGLGNHPAAVIAYLAASLLAGVGAAWLGVRAGSGRRVAT